MTVSEKEQIFEYLKEVKDPEVPVLDVVELGVVRDVLLADGEVQINITPTYSGCPAMKVMEQEIIAALTSRGFKNVIVKTVFSPPWTTEWMSEETKQKLKAYGIAPPGRIMPEDYNPLNWQEKQVSCPFCYAEDTNLTSQFGSTACKALYYCNSCQQPFEHFKCI